MGHYRSNLRDIEFNLFELLGRDEILGTGPFAEADPETARGILAEVERLAAGPIAESFAAADRHAAERRWTATMALTEPDAGSDVGAGRTKAIAQPDGTWHIEGVKRFITSAEHDMAENIFHLVLARPEGHGPGTKGLSMFLVPKFAVNEDGSLGERNGVVVTNLEHKMGLKASTTCEL